MRLREYDRGTRRVQTVVPGASGESHSRIGAKLPAIQATSNANRLAAGLDRFQRNRRYAFRIGAQKFPDGIFRIVRGMESFDDGRVKCIHGVGKSGFQVAVKLFAATVLIHKVEVHLFRREQV